ncbi:MAG: response regulator, partial [Armatimonadota bacterium]|nr:response regulator [Armatimonadota bacterium]
MSDKKNVVICDDDKWIRQPLAEALKERGLTVHVADTGGRALGIIDHDGIGVAVLDMKMRRGKNGIETAKQIQERHKDVSIIFLTGHIDEYRNLAEEAGVQAERWIDKDPEWLEKTQRAVLEELELDDFTGEILRRIQEAAQTAKLKPRQLDLFKKKFDPFSLAAPLASAPKPISNAPNGLEDVLQELESYLNEAWLGYSD